MIKVTTAIGWVLRLYRLADHPVTGVYVAWTDSGGKARALNYLDTIPPDRGLTVGDQLVDYGTAMEKRWRNAP